MNISWQYLDKRKASVSALKDFSSMKAIIANTGSEIADLHSRMAGVSGIQYSDLPKGPHNPASTEDRLLKGIDEIDLLTERYRQAVEFVNWFQPAWDTLTAEERETLEIFYLSEDSQTDAVLEICERFCIERSSAYKKKDRALAHLAILLYGK